MDILTTVFLYLLVTLDFKKNPRYSIGLEIRPQTALTIFRGLSHRTGRPLLPSDNTFLSRVEKPSDDKNSRLFLTNKKVIYWVVGYVTTNETE
jgi:hypothetical protein